MSRLLVSLSALVAILPLLPAQDSKTTDPLAPGNNLPATFHSYNVNRVVPPGEEPAEGKPRREYTTRGKFHCLISEHDLDPTVMLVVRNQDDSKGVQALLTVLDALVERHHVARLRAFAIFVYDDLTNVITQDEKRQELALKLDRLVEDLKLRNVTIGLASPADLEKYALGNAGVTAILYRKLRIVASHKVAADKLDTADAPAVRAILDDVTAQFKLTLKTPRKPRTGS